MAGNRARTCPRRRWTSLPAVLTRLTRLTNLTAADRLPLTCTRAGTCCFGKVVWLNPWELAGLAAARGLAVHAFIAACTTGGGIRLRFAGEPDAHGLPACSQYESTTRGCLAHAGRPLACRLYPLGRVRQGGAGNGGKLRFVHEGRTFPCLAGCPEVRSLPQVSVGDYLAAQGVAAAAEAQDAYLEVAQDLAEAAFVLVFDSGLAARDQGFLERWRETIGEDPAARSAAIPTRLFRLLLDPGLDPALGGAAFAHQHRELLQARLQDEFGHGGDARALAEASAICLRLALHLLQSCGGDPADAARRWIAKAEGVLAGG